MVVALGRVVGAVGLASLAGSSDTVRVSAPVAMVARANRRVAEHASLAASMDIAQVSAPKEVARASTAAVARAAEATRSAANGNKAIAALGTDADFRTIEWVRPIGIFLKCALRRSHKALTPICGVRSTPLSER